jgi:hypothetical protein
VLVSATPINNHINDIESQLKLFQLPTQSDIPGLPDYEGFFRKWTNQIERKKADRNKARKTTGLSVEQVQSKTALYKKTLEQAGIAVRDRILRYTMVRRTRMDIRKYYMDDLTQQGMHFPEVLDPIKFTYEWEGTGDAAFDIAVELLEKFSYSRYRPLTYLKRTLSPLEAESQKNVVVFMKTLLVKRLESSVVAFQKTIQRFIRNYEAFISLYERGFVFIGDEYDILELDLEDTDELEKLFEKGDEKGRRYAATDFVPNFIRDLEADRDALYRIRTMWERVTTDPKFERFKKELVKGELKGKRLILFTESAETGDYLYQNIVRLISTEKVLYVYGKGAKYQDVGLNKQEVQEILKNNFDPRSKPLDTTIQILITTDVLAEGINLHACNNVLNYDLPWNPTRLMQRVGRVNRVGSPHATVHIFNFFPTAQSKKALPSIEENIQDKLEQFNLILGEDSRYLYEDEEVDSREIFQAMNNVHLDEDETDPYLYYLDTIKQVKKDDPDLFDLVKRIPKKARVAFRNPPQPQGLTTFVRKGRLKKFYFSNGKETEEKSFLEAIKGLYATPEIPALPLPEDYYALINANKQALITNLELEDPDATSARGNKGHIYTVVSRLDEFIKSPLVRSLTEADIRYLKQVYTFANWGFFAEGLYKRLKDGIFSKEAEFERKPELLVGLLKDELHGFDFDILSEKLQPESSNSGRQEVILSGYVLG